MNEQLSPAEPCTCDVSGDGPDEDCPQHGNPEVLGYCPLPGYRAWVEQGRQDAALIKELRTAITKMIHQWDEDQANAAKREAALRTRAEKAEAERDGAYRERAHLIAYLAALHPSHIGHTDPNAPDWAVLVVETPGGQMSWHVAPDDMDLFAHVQPTNRICRGWDGHTTDEKYGRLRNLTNDHMRGDAAAHLRHMADDAPDCAPSVLVDRSAVLREAADVAARWNSDCQNCATELHVARELRRMAGETEQS